MRDKREYHHQPLTGTASGFGLKGRGRSKREVCGVLQRGTGDGAPGAPPQCTRPSGSHQWRAWAPSEGTPWPPPVISVPWRRGKLPGPPSTHHRDKLETCAYCGLTHLPHPPPPPQGTHTVYRPEFEDGEGGFAQQQPSTGGTISLCLSAGKAVLLWSPESWH